MILIACATLQLTFWSVFPSVDFLFVFEFFQTTTITYSVMATDYFSTVRALPGNAITRHAPEVFVHAGLAYGKSAPTGPIEWGQGLAACTGSVLSATKPRSFSRTALYRVWHVQP